MTLSQILELIQSSIGSLTFLSSGAPGTAASSSSGILKGLGYAIAVFTPASQSFSPLLFFVLCISLVGLGIGLIKRIIKL